MQSPPPSSFLLPPRFFIAELLQRKGHGVSSCQGFPTARGSLPYYSWTIHFPVFREIPVSESKQAFAFANYYNEQGEGKKVIKI
jgi:hypothetical protein